MDHNLLEKDFCDLVASCFGRVYANTATKVENPTQTPNTYHKAQQNHSWALVMFQWQTGGVEFFFQRPSAGQPDERETFQFPKSQQNFSIKK